MMGTVVGQEQYNVNVKLHTFIIVQTGILDFSLFQFTELSMHK